MAKPKAGRKCRGSIARQTLMKMAVTIALVIVATTVAAYYRIASTIEEQTLAQLEKYVTERGEREQELFLLAQDNHAIARKALVERMSELGDTDPEEEFSRLFIRCGDGVTRNRSKLFDGTRLAGVFVDETVPIDADIRRRVLTFYELCNHFGPAWNNRFQDTYITSPDGIMVIYWPSVPDWCQVATTDLELASEEYSWVADKEHNPSRQSAWTGLFFDHVAKVWMMSCETPVDIDGRHIATIGHDITLNELFERTIEDHLPGTHNLIFRSDGRLISSPEYVEKIKAQNGYFDIETSGGEHLKNVYRLISRSTADAAIVENTEDNEYLAVTKIEGPDWYFVTVFPKSIVGAMAFKAARCVLILGLVSLIVEIAILAFIIRKQVATPLTEFVRATDELVGGRSDIKLDTDRDDELGRLAVSFNRMRDAIQEKLLALNTEIGERKDIELKLRMSEQRYRLLAEQSSDVIWTADLNFNWEYISPAIERLCGFTVQESMRQPLHEMLTQASAERAMARLVEVMNAADKDPDVLNVPITIEVEFNRKDGTAVWTEVNTSFVRDENGHPTRLVGITRDITERRRFDAELLTAKEAAESANRAKSEFLANMSHEIRTPMTAVLGFAEMLRTEGDLSQSPADRIEAVDTIIRNGEHLLNIINDILDLSQIEAGRMEIDRSTCVPCQVVSDVVSLMRVRAYEKGLSLTAEFDGEIPDSIQSDSNRLRQILINLVGNAIKFTETGEVRVVVWFSGQSSTEPQIHFEVIDTGIGMSKEQISRLFKPFSQVDSSTTRKFGGTGLGLAISKSLAAMLGGVIDVRSSPGEGSTFALEIPTGSLEDTRLINSQSEAEYNPCRSNGVAVDHGVKLDCRILLAEDGPDNQRIISLLLRKAGAEVTVADNGQIAVDYVLARQEDFDVILMDMQMPVMDGYDATQTLRSHGYAGPIIAITAHAMKGDRQRCLDVGCDDYLTKPIDRATFLPLIARYAQQQSVNSEMSKAP